MLPFLPSVDAYQQVPCRLLQGGLLLLFEPFLSFLFALIPRLRTLRHSNPPLLISLSFLGPFFSADPPFK